VKKEINGMGNFIYRTGFSGI